MASRMRHNTRHLFECFLEVVKPSSAETSSPSHNASPWILQTYPPSYKDKEAERLKAVPPFVFPCPLEIETVQNFSFVMTNLEAQWTFGFCRLAPNSQTALVILSSFPWHESFYKLLNHAAEVTLSNDDGELWRFLESCYESRLPEPGTVLQISWMASVSGQSQKKDFTCQIPHDGRLPSIPENRNLTEYYNAVGIHNMLVIFASMLYERRIIITSKKLSRLSACVQAANSMIYPMHWQHIFIPVLPKHLIEYLSAPMPFLVGVPSPLMERVKSHELGEAVILNADTNVIRSPFSDLESLPFEVSANLKRSLKNHKDLLGESVARAFLQALVHLIGGYRDALKFRPGDKITFDKDSFLNSRPPTIQPFLEQMLQLQIFNQFIEERLTMLNTGKGFSDEFENEAVRFQEKMNQNSKFKNQYVQLSSSVRKEGVAIAKAVKSKMSPIMTPRLSVKKKKDSTNPAVKNAVKSVREGSRGLQHKSKSAYREMRSKMKTTNSSSHLDQDMQHHLNSGKKFSHLDDVNGRERIASSSSAPSSPVLANRRAFSISSNSSGSSTSNSNASQPAPKTMTLANFGRNNTDISFGNRVLKYERFDPPPLNGASQDKNRDPFEAKLSPEMEGPKPIDLDLMNDLQEVFRQKQADSKMAPPINRNLKPHLKRTSNIFSSSSQPNLFSPTSYENLEDNEDDDPFNTEHAEEALRIANKDNKFPVGQLPLPPENSPVVRLATEKERPVSPITPSRPRRFKKFSLDVESQAAPPIRPKRSLDQIRIDNPAANFSFKDTNADHQRKPSMGDLIKLDSNSIDESTEVVFDPLLEPKPNSKPSKPPRGLPHPPSASTLPEITQIFASSQDHKPLQRSGPMAANQSPSISNNPFSPDKEGNPFLLRKQPHNPSNGNGVVMDNASRGMLTKSSDDLLKDYGIDFGKLSTSNFSAASNANNVFLEPSGHQRLPMSQQQNALSLIGSNPTISEKDPFADLDPLKQSSSLAAPAAANPAAMRPHPPPPPHLPLAPPRAKKQSWTTFD